MKIIKQGVVPQPQLPKVYRGTCGHCGCVFDCEEADFVMRRIMQMCGRYDWAVPSYAVTCPTCYTPIDAAELTEQKPKSKGRKK